MAFRLCVLALKGSLTYFLVSVVLSSIQLSGSQNEEVGLSDNETNLTNINPACEAVTCVGKCQDLPAACINCDFFGKNDIPDCKYGVSTNFSCWPLDFVECEVSYSVATCLCVVFFLVLPTALFLLPSLISTSSSCFFVFFCCIPSSLIYVYSLNVDKFSREIEISQSISHVSTATRQGRRTSAAHLMTLVMLVSLTVRCTSSVVPPLSSYKLMLTVASM